MVPQDPKLSIGLVASGNRTNKLLMILLFVSCEMVCQVLRHFKAFVTILKCAFEYSYGQMTFQMLAVF